LATLPYAHWLIVAVDVRMDHVLPTNRHVEINRAITILTTALEEVEETAWGTIAHPVTPKIDVLIGPNIKPVLSRPSYVV
jgi:hypothetical protein